MRLPYPELKIKWMNDNSEFQLSCPWMSVTVEVEPSQREIIKQQTTPAFSSEFLEHFLDYPFSYDRPMACTARGKSKARSKQNALEQCLRGFEGTWDANELCAAKILGSAEYDPRTAYGLIRRQRLLAETEAGGPSVYDLMNELRIKDEARFFNLCKKVIAQNLHVTSRCPSALAPALSLPGLNQHKVEEFRQSELGHDGFALRSLEQLGCDKHEAQALPVLSSTSRSVDLLEAAAASNGLAFSCLVGLFEGDNYGEQDPLAKILRRSSRPLAAVGLEAHFRINKHEHHALVGETFVRDMPLVSHAEVIEALRATELCVKLGFEMIEQLKSETLACLNKS